MSKRILLILAHPAPQSFCHALAEQYVLGATQAGADIKQLTLSELNFDLSFQGYKTESAQLEPDLQEAQRLIQWAEHLVFVYPLWWGAMPALLKGFIKLAVKPRAFRPRI